LLKRINFELFKSEFKEKIEKSKKEEFKSNLLKSINFSKEFNLLNSSLYQEKPE